MAATDLFVEVGDPGSATTLDANYTAADSTVTVVSTTNWPSTGKAVIFAIDEATVVDGVEVQTAGTYNEFEGTVASASSISNVAWQRGAGDRNYSAGSLTRVYIPVSAERENRLVEGFGTEHNITDGTHSNVTATSVSTDTISEVTAANGVAIDGMTVKDGAVVGASGKGVLNSSLGTGTGELGGAWQSWTPTWVNVTVGNGTIDYAKYLQIGKTVFFRIKFTLGSTSSITGSVTLGLPVNASATYDDVNEDTVAGALLCRDTSLSGLNIGGLRIDTTSTHRVIPFVVNAASTYAGAVTPNGSIPFTWATGDAISMSGSYEAA